MCQLEVIRLLVRTDVQRADNHALAAHALGNRLVRLELLLLGRIIIVLQIQELRAEQADAAAVIGEHLIHIVRRTDVAVYHDLAAVNRHILLALELIHEFLHGALLGVLLAQTLMRDFIRLNKQLTGLAVNPRGLALVVLAERIAGTDDSRNAHRARQNCRVAVAGAALRDKAQNLGLVQLYGLRRSQIVRCQNNRHIRINTACHSAAQNTNDAVGNILDVCGARLHVAVVHRGKHLCKLLRHLRNGIFCIDLFAVNQILNALYIVEVIQHHLMRFKQFCAFFAYFCKSLFIQRLELLHRGLASRFKALLFRFCICNLMFCDVMVSAPIKTQRSICHTAGNAFSLNGIHNRFLPHCPPVCVQACVLSFPTLSYSLHFAA